MNTESKWNAWYEDLEEDEERDDSSDNEDIWESRDGK